jgi:hypothetical protein
MPICKRERDRAASHAVIAEAGSAAGVGVDSLRGVSVGVVRGLSGAVAVDAGEGVEVRAGGVAVGADSIVMVGEGSGMEVGFSGSSVAVAGTAIGFAPDVAEGRTSKVPVGERPTGTRCED